ncbi:MAG: tRNA epoxyqueuosine(34) reductase QueG [Nitrospiria bacterium]
MRAIHASSLSKMNPAQGINTQTSLTKDIKSLAIEFGFHLVGITSANPLASAGRHYRRWLSDGFSGKMAYLKKSPEIRYDPKKRFPEAQSVISLALNYYQPKPHEKTECALGSGNPAQATKPVPGKIAGKIARYAWGEDYHHIIEEKLIKLIAEITVRGGMCWKGYVDHGPLLERAFAERAGLGFIGKNTNLITPQYGSWVFLAEIVTNLALNTDSPMAEQCASCRRCLDACPTGALTEAYRLDARRCISYLTIENKDAIPEHLVSDFDGWVFGCDICQEVCPYNKERMPTDEPGLSYRRGAGPTLKTSDIEAIQDNSVFKKRFKKTPILRAKRAGLIRNAVAARQSMEDA